MSSTFLPRLAAMAPGECMPARPLTVARTRLIGLREPTALASTSFTPTASSTARMAPPAITPVPSEAGCMNTRAAPWPALTVCHRGGPLRSTLRRFLRAYSIDFWSATGTSRALPSPTPTWPLPSPPTFSALKVNWRPPWTVLLTRLAAIIFSFMPSSISSRSRLRSRPRFSRGSAIAVSLSGRECCGLAAYRCGLERWIASGGQKPRSARHSPCRRVRQEGGAGTAAPPPGSELQATLAGGGGQRLHAAVVTVARAVEGDLLDPRGLGLLRDRAADLGVGPRLTAAVVPVARAVEGDLLDPRGLGLLGDRAADLGGGLDVLGALEALAHGGLGGAGGGQDLRAVGAEHLGVDVLAGAQHR